MDIFVHQVVAGLVSGGVYASIGLALVIVYQSTHAINFAQGEMATFSAYLAWSLVQAGQPYAIAFLGALAASFIIGIGVERLLVRPVMKEQPGLRLLAIFVGLFLLFNALSGALFGHVVRTFPSPFPSGSPFGTHLITFHELGSLLVTLGLVGVFYSFFRFTRLGLAMRAAALQPVSAKLAGIPVARMLSMGWGLAAMAGATAGMLIAPLVFLEPGMMAGILVYGFAAALVGGIDNPWGAVAGGFLVGVVENLLGTYVIGTELKLTIALALIVGVLMVKPSGLFGRTKVQRV